MTRTRRTFQFLFLMCSLFIMSCARFCSKSDDIDRPITVDLSLPVEALDPRYTKSAATASRVSHLVYATLFELGDDLFPKPLLAENVLPLDSKSFKITLRKNLKFHDGSSLTAQDVVYTYKELGSKDVASPEAEKFNYVDDIRALDEHTVIFELKEPHAPFLTDLCAIGIVSKKSCEGRSKECRHEYLGSGPYRVKKFDTAKESIHLVPFAEWFEGPPKNEILFRVVRDENTRILELIGKKADIVDGEISPSQALELKKQAHLSVKEIPGLGFTYLAINVRGPKPDEEKDTPQYKTRLALSNQKVRKAIAHAIDFEKIIEKLMLNTAERASGLIPNGHWAKDENLKAPNFDAKLAEQLLDEAGFMRTGSDQMRFKLVISVTPARIRQSAAELYADFLKRVGIDASIRVKDWSALFQDMKQGQFELFSAIWVPVTDPDLYYFVHHSASIPAGEKAGGNRHGYKNSDVDRLIELGRITMEPEKRKEIYQEIERKMIEELPYIPLWNEHRIVVLNAERVHGFTPSPTGSLMGLKNAYLSTMKKASH